MLNISFRRNSLLYGESCFLIAHLLFVPYFFWPDSFKTRTKHVLIMTKSRRKVLKLIIQMWNNFVLRFIVLAFIVCTQIPYALILIVVGALVQKDSLAVLNGLEEDGLAYKALYYAPILNRLGIFLMILMALWNRSKYRVWPTLDHYDVFSVDRASQLRVIFFCSLIIIPDIICSWVETMFLFTWVRSDRHKWFQFTRRDKAMNLTFILVASGVTTTSCILRYKPFVSILYSALCVREHMSLLRSQLSVSFSGANSSSTANLLMGRPDGQAKAVGHNQGARISKRAPKSAEKSLPKPAISQLEPWRQHLDSRLASKQRQISLYIDSKMADSKRQSAMLEVPQIDLILGHLEPPAGWLEDPLYEIHNLFEFERHLTQIHLFVASMDRCSPGAIFVLTFFNIVAFFWAYLYNRSLPSEITSLTMASLFLSSRILPVCILFIAGHLVELECRKISNLVEVIYLENISHSLLYQQLKDSQNSLCRVFRLLSWIKFDGDGLMAINLDSLKRLLFYVSSAIFIVIQYDSLLVIEDSAPAVGSAGPPLGTNRVNASQYLQIDLT